MKKRVGERVFVFVPKLTVQYKNNNRIVVRELFITESYLGFSLCHKLELVIAFIENFIFFDFFIFPIV